MPGWFKSVASTDVRKDVKLGHELAPVVGRSPRYTAKCGQVKATAHTASIWRKSILMNCIKPSTDGKQGNEVHVNILSATTVTYIRKASFTSEWCYTMPNAKEATLNSMTMMEFRPIVALVSTEDIGLVLSRTLILSLVWRPNSSLSRRLKTHSDDWESESILSFRRIY